MQGTGFEPAKHYAQRPERCPFDRSGTPAESPSNNPHYFTVVNNNPTLYRLILMYGAGGRIRTYEALHTGT